MVLPPDAFETFLHGSIFDKTAFRLLERQGTCTCLLVNNECSSWYNRVGDFLVSIWEIRKQLLYTNESACMARQNNATPLKCMLNGTEC